MPTKFTVGEFGKKDQMNVKQPSSTKAMQLQQQKRREEIDQEKAAKEKLAREDKKRAQREKELAKSMVEPRLVYNFDNGRRDGKAAKLSMLHTYIDTMIESGLNIKECLETLKREERELLDEEVFIEKLKKKHGRTLALRE